jgi:uncharacterized membrane protein YhaH (DUF805 family)
MPAAIETRSGAGTVKSLSLLFNTSGRLSRRQFWLAHLFILGATIAFSVIAGLIIGIVSSLPGLAPLADWGPTVIGGAVALTALSAEMIVAIRRMHDRDASGLWVVGVVFVAIIANLVIGGQLLASGANPVTPLTLGLSAFTLIMGGWMLFELGFLRGTDGANRFGTDPLNKASRQDAGEEPMLLTEAVSGPGAAR